MDPEPCLAADTLAIASQHELLGALAKTTQTTKRLFDQVLVAAAVLDVLSACLSFRRPSARNRQHIQRARSDPRMPAVRAE